ncbi:hypothetical protein BJ912DRAFT_923536 [Pholiota molesta]|nr:hypothetical protein BJ912DRAFT_923536 [Pholiota molesta]
MPIRLLHIVPTVERGGVYAHLANQLDASYSESAFRSEVEKNIPGSSLELDLGIDWTRAEEVVMNKWVTQIATYAILSHTWIRTAEGEVTYKDWLKGAFDGQQPGYQKLIGFCKASWTNHKISFGWMDTICINKESSSELDESIRSMYKWYRNSCVCITYLAKTVKLSEIRQDPWFTRGSPFTDKDDIDIAEQIQMATTITISELTCPDRMHISRKMQLAAKREVMREEDIAYSLMGVCNVSISIAYGEGAKQAFFRLMTEILNSSGDIQVLSIFNCAQDPPMSSQPPSIIPSTPLAYIQRSSRLEMSNLQKPIEPFMLTHLGLRIPILLMPSLQEDDPSFRNDPIGDYYAFVNFKPWPAFYQGTYHLLDKGTGACPKQDGSTWNLHSSTVDSNSKPGLNATFGILNFGGGQTVIEVPKICLAVGFWSHWSIEWESTSTPIDRRYTESPIVFELMDRNAPVGDVTHPTRHIIKRRELAKHGIKLVTMYL